MVERLASALPGRAARHESQHGFSLVELLIATLVGSATLSAAVLITDQVSRGYTSQLDGAMVQEEARFALDWIEEALRSAGSNPYSIAASNCPAAGTAFRAIRRDPNGNGVMDDVRIQADVNPPNALLGGLAAPCGEPGEDITIGHDPAGQTITLLDNNLGGAPMPMTDGVITLLRFRHLDANRVVTANENAIAFVQVAVTAQGPNRDRQLGQPATVTLTSEVRVRTR